MSNLHFNSLAAYNENYERLNAREKMIYDWLLADGTAMTEREIKDDLFGKEGDMNMVRPRITKLVQDGWLVETGNTVDKITAVSVRLVKAVPMADLLDPATTTAQIEMAL